MIFEYFMTSLRRSLALAAVLALSVGTAMADPSLNIIRMQAPIAESSSWAATSPLLSAWASSGAAYNCSNWSPSPSAVAQGQTFSQTATDCQQEQQRTSQPRELNSKTQAIRNVGAASIESKTVGASLTRSAVGTQAAPVILAKEGGSFTLASAATVRYGLQGGSAYFQKYFEPGSYACSSAVFGGDPAGGWAKLCFIP